MNYQTLENIKFGVVLLLCAPRKFLLLHEKRTHNRNFYAARFMIRININERPGS